MFELYLLYILLLLKEVDHMKKWVALILSVALVLSLAACSNHHDAYLALNQALKDKNYTAELISAVIFYLKLFSQIRVCGTLCFPPHPSFSYENATFPSRGRLGMCVNLRLLLEEKLSLSD